MVLDPLGNICITPRHTSAHTCVEYFLSFGKINGTKTVMVLVQNSFVTCTPLFLKGSFI